MLADRMIRSRRRPLPVLAPLLLAALLLATLPACGGGSGSGAGAVSPGGNPGSIGFASPDALRGAADRTLARNSGRFEVRVTAALEGLPAGGTELGPVGTLPDTLDLSYTGEGAYDVAAARSTLRVELGSLLGSLVGGFGDDDAGSVNDRLRRLAGDRRIEVVHDGLSVHYRVPLISALTRAEGDTWVKLDLAEARARATDLGVGVDDVVGRAGGLVGSGVVLPSADPSAVLGLLRGVDAQVEVVGPAKVRDVDTTEYRATASLRRALAAQVSDDDRARMRMAVAQVAGGDRLLAAADSAAEVGVPVHVYLDADGAVRRLEVLYRVGAEASGSGADGEERAAGPAGSVTAVYDYFAFGDPVDIAVPEGDEVVDLLHLDVFVDSLRDRDHDRRSGSTGSTPPA